MATNNSINNQVTSGNFTVTAGNVVVTAGNVTLPTTSSTVGQITLNSNRFLHGYGTNNTFLGTTAGNLTLTTSCDNVCIGYNSGTLLTTTDNAYNTFVGSQCGKSTASPYNTFVGYKCGYGAIMGWALAHNTFIGAEVASVTSGNSNTEQCVAIGYQAMKNIVQNNQYSVYIGYQSAVAQTANGGYDTFVGAQSGYSITGSSGFNTLIGYRAGGSLVTGNTYNICLGYSVPGVNGDTGVIRIGNSTNNTSAFISGIYNYTGTIGTTGTAAVIIDSAGQIQCAHAYSADANCKTVSLIKSRGTSASPTTITANDALGIIDFRGHDGTGYIVGSQITSTNSGTVATDRIASDLKFYTHPDSTTASTLRMTIASTGATTIANPDSGTALTITGGGLTVTAGSVTVTPFNAAGVVTNNASGVLATLAVLTPALGGKLPVTECTASNAVTMVADNAYIATSTDGGTLVVFTLPATAAIGTLMEVTGKSSAYWEIDQNASQTIHMGAVSTTTGVTGKVTTAHQWASVTLRCVTADTDWVIISNTGTVTLA